MVKLQRRPFGEPDDAREIPYGRLETYDLGEIRIGRSIYFDPCVSAARLAAGPRSTVTDATIATASIAATIIRQTLM